MPASPSTMPPIFIWNVSGGFAVTFSSNYATSRGPSFRPNMRKGFGRMFPITVVRSALSTKHPDGPGCSMLIFPLPWHSLFCYRESTAIVPRMLAMTTGVCANAQFPVFRGNSCGSSPPGRIINYHLSWPTTAFAGSELQWWM